jgi:protein-disulfide isomerase
LLISLSIFIVAGCRNRNVASKGQTQTDRQIELMIRSQYNVPADYGVTFGSVRASDIPGYDDLPVVFSHGGKHVDFEFLISNDRRWLARLQKFDLNQDLNGGIDVAGRPVLGNPAAKVTVVVYDDLQCPFCSRFSEQVVPQIMARYKDFVRVIYKDYPLSEIHGWATHAAINANCLAKQDPDSYWKYIDYVHSHYGRFNAGQKNLKDTFKKLDDLTFLEDVADASELRACIAAQDAALIKQSVAEADRLNVESTPTVYVNGERIVGLRPNEWLWAAIDRALAAKN